MEKRGMPAGEQGVAEIRELTRQLGEQIAQRTWGRVQDLHVEINPDGHVAVHGRVPTYYVKQLVVHAVREVVKTAPVTLHVAVASVRPLSVGPDQRQAGSEPVTVAPA